MIRILIYLLLFFSTINFCSYGQPSNGKLEVFPLSSVRLLESPFHQAQQADMNYILALDPDRLLAPFLADAGLQPKAERYGNWENTGLDGHIGGHYLSALSLMYASTGNNELLERLEYMLDELAKAQKKNGNGYVGGIPGGQQVWKDIAEGRIDAGNFSLNGKWVPLYNIHKLYAGLRDAYLIAGNEKARDMLIKLSDWLLDTTSGLSDAQIQQMLISEHGGMNEVLADVAAITNEPRYLRLAEKFSHKGFLEPLTHEKDNLTGMHANTQIPKVIGFQRVAEMNGNKEWSEAAEFFWNTVIDNRTVSIGGNSVREHFNPVNDFSSMIESNQGPETCNTYNMLRLTQMLFLQDPKAEYTDYYERALYNHILSSQHPEGGFVYFTPMRPRHYRVYSTPQQSFWCCVGSGLENHGKYGEMIYAHNGNDIYVNLYMPSVLSWTEKGITLTQKTSFPYEEKTELTLNLEKSARFNLYLRHPGWVKENEYKIKINGKPLNASSDPGTYLSINRKWKKGDKVTIQLPMHTTAEYLPDTSSWVSYVHGPMVLAAVTDSTDLGGIWADDTRMGHVAADKYYPLDEGPVIVAKRGQDLSSGLKPVKGSPLTFTASGLIEPDKFQHLKLVPFFQIHEARYQIYWPVVQQEELEKRERALKEKEEQEAALEAKTVDQIATGEQQPEAEHNFKGEDTATGINRGMFWRDARGWFSYDLINKGMEGKVLRISYFGGDSGRTFDILVDNNLWKTVTLDKKGDTFYDVDYVIPEKLLNPDQEKMNIKFRAHEGSVVGGIYYIRLLKEGD